MLAHGTSAPKAIFNDSIKINSFCLSVGRSVCLFENECGNTAKNKPPKCNANWMTEIMIGILVILLVNVL